MNKIVEIILLAGHSVILLLIILLLIKKNKSLADKIFIIWFGIIFIQLIDFYLLYANFTFAHPHLFGIFLPFALLHGPFILMYIHLLIKPAIKFPSVLLLHFFPAMTLYVLLIPFFLKSSPEKLEIINKILKREPPLLYIIFQIMLYIVGPVYLMASYYLLSKHKKNIKNTFSYTENINLDWVKLLMFGIGIIWVVIFILDSLDQYFNFPFNANLYTVITGTAAIIYLGFYGIRQTTIFTNRNHILQATELKTFRNKDEKRLISNKTISSEKHIKSLNKLMEEDKLYLQPKLSLYQLAENLKISTNQLSYIINEELKKNFFEFINEYRINEAKKRLIDLKNKNFTILSIAYDSGFNSKSTFNSLFKQHTGLTPGEYIEKNM